MQVVLKEKGGKGNHFEIPPADFLSDIDCAKKRRLAFLRNAREEMKSGSKYEKWCSSEFRLFDTTASKKCHQEKENVSCGEESIKLVRERSSGDIFDAERQVLSKNPDGTLKRSVIKETYARVTLRGKRKSVDEVSDSGQMKRARKMSNILDHTLENDKDAKAAIVAKIIDHDGPEF